MKRFNENIDMNRCYVTGITSGIIERHHAFGGANRTRSTFYGFVIPLTAQIHPNGAHRDDKACLKLTGKTVKEIDLGLKQECQRFYENELGRSREQFIKEFGKNYL